MYLPQVHQVLALLHLMKSLIRRLFFSCPASFSVVRFGLCLRPIGPIGPKGQNAGSRGIYSPVMQAKYHHVTYVTWRNMASHPGDKSPGYMRTPLTGLNSLDAKT